MQDFLSVRLSPKAARGVRRWYIPLELGRFLVRLRQCHRIRVLLIFKDGLVRWRREWRGWRVVGGSSHRGTVATDGRGARLGVCGRRRRPEAGKSARRRKLVGRHGRLAWALHSGEHENESEVDGGSSSEGE